MIYLDNGASTFIKPKCVIKAVKHATKHFTANPGRSGHKASIEAGQKVLISREKVATFYGVETENVIFTSGCTEALNLAILGTAKVGGHIVTTCFEHNSVLRTLEHLKTMQKIDYTVVYPAAKNGVLKVEEIANAVKKNTYLVIVNHVSNVLGIKQNVVEIGNYCKQNGLLFLVDSAQSSGHLDINLVRDNINMLAFAGHKGLYAIQGVGGLCLNGDVPLRPIKFGGTGTESENLTQPIMRPEGFESGTLATIAIISLGAGVDFVGKNLNKIEEKIKKLSEFFIKEFNENLNHSYKMLSPTPNISGVFSINHNKLTCEELANKLNQHKICVRSGLHCAPLAHKYSDTLDGGSVRISIGYFNNKRHIRKLIKILKKLA